MLVLPDHFQTSGSFPVLVRALRSTERVSQRLSGTDPLQAHRSGRLHDELTEWVRDDSQFWVGAAPLDVADHYQEEVLGLSRSEKLRACERHLVWNGAAVYLELEEVL